MVSSLQENVKKNEEKSCCNQKISITKQTIKRMIKILIDMIANLHELPAFNLSLYRTVIILKNYSLLAINISIYW